MTWAWLPEQGRTVQLTEDGRQVLWVRSRLGDVWRPNDTSVDHWWAMVGRQES